VDFRDMEALARAPQSTVNLHVIEKLDAIESNQLDAALLTGEHGKRIEAIEIRCKGCRVKVGALWAALGAAGLAVLGWLKFGK
jgi:hypothetical protein